MKSEYEKKAAPIRELVSMEPNRLAEHMADTHKVLSAVAPTIAAHVNATALRAISFLNSKMPKPTFEAPGSPEFEPSPSQQAAFLHYHEMVNKPISVLQHVKDGTLSSHHMEALQAVHPDLLQEMQSKVMENATPKNMEKLSYPKKIALSKFLGQPMDQSMLPGVIFSNQAGFAQPQQQVAGATKPKKPTQSGLNKLDTAKLAETETTHLEDEND
jgi:hypothetical protein